jgi:hypothetical protein
MKKCFNFFIFFLIISFTYNYAQKVVIIDSYTGSWTDTGVNITSGQRLSIYSYGFASSRGKIDSQDIGYWGSPGGTTYAQGLAESSYLAPNLPKMSLVAKIGSGNPFYTGEYYSQPATISGRLYLAYNDQIGGYSDNFGYFISVVITPSTLVTSIQQDGDNIQPTSLKLSQNYPNPFNGQTTIEFDIPQTENISIKIYNELGQEVRELFSGLRLAGYNSLIWDGKNNYGNTVSSGKYFYQINTSNYTSTKKMIFLK